uniref:Uncharacterized protein n=1 Tax=Schizaphis graminum TaxID=13262 RepID=A0A2S2NQX8_SCHGA
MYYYFHQLYYYERIIIIQNRLYHVYTMYTSKHTIISSHSNDILILYTIVSVKTPAGTSPGLTSYSFFRELFESIFVCFVVIGHRRIRDFSPFGDDFTVYILIYLFTYLCIQGLPVGAPHCGFMAF